MNGFIINEMISAIIYLGFAVTFFVFLVLMLLERSKQKKGKKHDSSLPVFVVAFSMLYNFFNGLYGLEGIYFMNQLQNGEIVDLPLEVESLYYQVRALFIF